MNSIKKLIQGSLDKGHTQHALASEIKISQSTIYKILNTETMPRIETLQKIGDYYRVNPGDLIESMANDKAPSPISSISPQEDLKIRQILDIAHRLDEEYLGKLLILAETVRDAFEGKAGRTGAAPQPGVTHHVRITHQGRSSQKLKR